MTWEHEFLRLAAWFLIARKSLLQGETVIEDGWPCDDAGCYTGMVDNAYEMKLIVQEQALILRASESPSRDS